MNYRVYVLMLLILPEIVFAQVNQNRVITAGPFVGSVTTSSAKVWLSCRGSGEYRVTLWDSIEDKHSTSIASHAIANSKGDTSLILDYTGLQAGRRYKVIFSDMRTKLLTPPCYFTTQSPEPVKDLDFLVGSCALLNTGFTGVFFPGLDIRIFTPMTKAKTDFMLWLGDNIYYLGRDYKGYNNMFNRNLKIRRNFKTLDFFLASKPQYSIWDDHDYGWNDSDRHFPLKDTALTIFRGFWPNTYEDTVKETYFTFRYSDAEFFMTDGRWFRETPGDTAGDFLGPQQLAWLKNKLLKSDATFKFICMGSQVLNDNEHGESYAHYPKERNNLLDYIVDNDIKGVIFLTGDKHYTEICKRNYNDYPIVDFTCSPLTSPVLPRRLLGAYDNPTRVPGMDYSGHNYGRVSLSGPPGDRVCTLEVHGRHGKKRRELVIHQSELQRK